MLIHALTESAHHPRARTTWHLGIIVGAWYLCKRNSSSCMLMMIQVPVVLACLPLFWPLLSIFELHLSCSRKWRGDHQGQRGPLFRRERGVQKKGPLAIARVLRVSRLFRLGHLGASIVINEPKIAINKMVCAALYQESDSETLSTCRATLALVFQLYGCVCVY
jgi:hypothetical protein